MQSEKNKSDEEELSNQNNLRNRLGERVELNKINHENFIENESKLIKQNFKLFNDNIIILLTSGRLKLKIKEYITERTIYLLLELWNIFDLNDDYFKQYAIENQEAIYRLLRILIDFISRDSKIFKDEYKNYLANILRLCNILISICDSKESFYLDLKHLIYKISDTQSRLILSVILNQINQPIKFPSLHSISDNDNFEENFYSNFGEIYTVIIKLNITRQGKSLEYSDDLDVDLALENLNLINDQFCAKYTIVHLEPLVYQLISLANFSDDFSIQTLAIAKVKIILDRILTEFERNVNNLDSINNSNNLESYLTKMQLESFANILKVFLNLLNLLNYNIHINKNIKNNFNGENYTSLNKMKQENIKKNILDLFSYINNAIHNNQNDKENNLLEKINEAEASNLINDDNNEIADLYVYSVSTINFKIFDFDSEIYSIQNSNNYIKDYLNNFSLIICKDLFAIKSEKGDYDFFEGIMNLKFDIRSSVLNQLKSFLIKKQIKYFSLLNIILPVIKGFLNFETKDSNANQSKQIQSKKNENFDVFHKRTDINAITNAAIDLLEPIAKMLKKDDFLAFLMHFYRRISKANNQDSSRTYEDNRYTFEKLYEILSRLLECLNYFKFSFITEFDFDAEFNETMRQLIIEYKSKACLEVFLDNKQNENNNKNNIQANEDAKLSKLDDNKVNKFTNNKAYSKDLFKESFNKIAQTYEEKLKTRQLNKPSESLGNSTKLVDFKSNNLVNKKMTKNNFDLNNEKKNKFKEFSQNLTTQIFNMLRNMLIDSYRKDKTKKYYIRNFVIKPFFLVLKKMDPRTLKYELLSLVYEIINNLKNKDLEVRDKARNAICILIETLGPFISNVLFDQLKSQLTSGYQRYIMGYTCNYVLGILNKLYLNFKEIEEHGEAFALRKIMDESKMQIEFENDHAEQDNEDKVITLAANKNISIEKNQLNKAEKINYQKIIEEINTDNNNNNTINPLLSKNLDFAFLNRYKQFNKKDIELVFDFSIGIVVPILLEELFGEVAEEKEIEQLVKKYKEGREVKAYSSFNLIAARMDFKTGILNLIFPLRNFVLDKETNNSIINKINEIMNFIIKGLKENITMRIEDIILISYSLINIGLDINIKNSKEIKLNKKVIIKGEVAESKKAKNDYQAQKNELVSLQLGTNSKKRYSIEIAKKFVMEKNDIILSNLFTQFGLDIFFLSIKKNVFDYNSLKANIEKIKEKEKSNSLKLKAKQLKESNSNKEINENEDLNSQSSENSDDYQVDLFNEFNIENFNNNQPAHYHKHRSYYDKHRINYSEEEFKNIINQMEVLLYSVICCLKITSNNILSKSLKILTKLFDSRLFVIKKNLKKIGSNIFKNLGVINLSDSDKTIAQTILSCISEILKKFTFFEVSDSQMKILINFLKIYINNLEIKSYIFSCLFAIIKRKFLHPCIYDMIDYIQETYLISFDEATKSLCESILLEFLNNYPLQDPRKQKHVNFFIINLESKTRNCVLNSLRMLRKLVEFGNKDLNKNENDTAKSNSKKNYALISHNGTNQVAIVIKDYIDFMILKLLLLIANTSDAEIKNLSSALIQEIFEHMISKEKYELYLGKIVEWIKIEEKIRNKIKKINNNDASDDESEENKDIDEENCGIYLDEKEKTYVKLGLNFLSILSNTENENLELKANDLFEILMKNIKFEYKKFEKELDRQIENRNYSKISEDAYSSKKDFDKLFETTEQNDSGKEEENDSNKKDELELKEDELTILSIQLENWDVYYLHLISLEKLISLFPNIFGKKLIHDKQFSQLLFRSIKHPHVFIKTTILRLITKLFSEESKIINMNNFEYVNAFINNLTTDKSSNYIDNENVHSNTIQVIFENLKFIILNKDINLKEDLVNSAIEISSFLVFLLLKLYIKNSELNNKQFEDYSFYAYEFICKLYAQSKKFMAKKEFTNKVIRRILIIFENLVTYSNLKYNMFDTVVPNDSKKNKNSEKLKNNKKEIENEIKQSKGKLVEILLEPVLSMLFRLTTNNLIDEEIKVYAENILASLRDIIEEQVFSTKYKEITKRIVMLRRKRKIEQKQNYLKK